ncbi:rRNA maturation RNase YbeY [bacterium]|nr:rRNA maturation RNase YbeY [bacterium]
MHDSMKYWQITEDKDIIHWNFIGQKRRYSTSRMQNFSNCLKKAVCMIDKKIAGNGFELSIIVCDKDTIRAMKKEYFNIDRETDVIALSMLEGEYNQFCGSMIGDIYICHDVIKENAVSWTVDQELAFVLIHGLLHIFSYSDIKPEDKKKMFKFQKKIFDKCYKDIR